MQIMEGRSVKSLIRSTTRSRSTPQIRNTLCNHMYMFPHSLLLITYWPEDGQSRPKHVVVIEQINYVTQTVVFWRTYPPSFSIYSLQFHCIFCNNIIFSSTTGLNFKFICLFTKQRHSQYQISAALSEIKLIRFVALSKQHKKLNLTH
jgi:hypothetical protein